MASVATAVVEPEIEIHFDEIETRTVFADVRDLLAEWREAAHKIDGVPHQQEFDAQIDGPRGANLMLLRACDGDFHYERVGRDVVALFGHDPSGRMLDDILYRGAQAFATRYRYCVATGAPLFAVQQRVSFGVPGASERLLLPLKLADGADGLLVYIRSRADNYDLIRAVFNASQHGVVVASAIRDADKDVVDLELTAVNAAAAELIGGDPTDLIGQRLKPLFERFDLSPVWADIMVALESGAMRTCESLDLRRPNGGVFRINTARVGDGVAISIYDLTQLQRAMQTLEIQHAKLAQTNAELRSEVARRRRLEDELKQLAATDPLTGIANRRSFMDGMDEQLRRADTTSGRASLILFDVDEFKSVNDRYGHPVGDRVLRAIAAIAKDCFGDDAVFGRLGGEEFAVFLSAAEAGFACETAERLRCVIDEEELGTPEAPLHVTASFGVASMGPPYSAEKLVEKADAALYTAKRGGRNRVICDNGAEREPGAVAMR